MAGSFAGMSHALTAPLLQRRGRTWKDGMAENEPWQDPKSPQDARLASLDERLRQAQAGESTRNGGHEGAAADLKPFHRLLSVLIAYPLGSALIGYAIDQVAGTRVIWVVMMFVGFGLAIREVWKMSKQSPK